MKHSNDEIEISIKDLILSIWDLRRAILLLIILGGIAGVLFSFQQEPAYTAKASILVTARTGNGTYQNGNESPAPKRSISPKILRKLSGFWQPAIGF